MFLRPLSLSLFLLGFTASFVAAPLHSQATMPSQSAPLVFKANARTVVLDVVVTDRNGRPVTGLHQESFGLEEDGHPQTVTYFEEHTGTQALAASLPPLPPNVFTNIPRVKPGDAVTVLLLDSLNTQLQDQSFVHAQMLKYLKTLQPGNRMAIIALGSRLRFIQGFTDDPSLLAAALNNPKLGVGPKGSPLLPSQGEITALQQTTASLQGSPSNPPSGLAAAGAFGEFQGERLSFQYDQRASATFTALQELAYYLSGVPGRKNVVWFAGSFPVIVFPGAGMKDGFALQRTYEDEVRKTDALLTAAQVAIYPVAAEGLTSAATYDVGNQPAGVTGAADAQHQLTQSLQTDSQQRNATRAAMEEIAKDTGGAAFTNTNGLADAVARVVDHGSSYYTMTYTPSNAATDSLFRKVQVKLNAGDGYKLAYRRGYYAAATKDAQPVAKPAGDPLRPFMTPGMPSSTQIPLALRIQQIATIPAGSAASKPAGDNAAVPAPLTRYRVDFVIAASGLELDANPDGSYHGKIEATVVAYDHAGAPVNWIVRQLDLDMDAARYAQVKANGVNFNLDIDVPNSGVTLRSGIFDLNAKLAGTLEVPLVSVTDPVLSSHK